VLCNIKKYFGLNKFVHFFGEIIIDLEYSCHGKTAKSIPSIVESVESKAYRSIFQSILS
jgi:hypothetical protein